MSGRLNKAKKFYSTTEKSSLKAQDPISIVKTMVKELQNSMNIVIDSTGKEKERFVRTKYFSRSLVIIYTLQTTLDFEKGEKLATKLFQIYEYCRQQLIKCFREQVVEGTHKAINALENIFNTNVVKSNVKDQSYSTESQLDKLERISSQISLLISQNDYEKISHLDRMRKKIISDMQEKNLELSTMNKKSVLS